MNSKSLLCGILLNSLIASDILAGDIFTAPQIGQSVQPKAELKAWAHPPSSTFGTWFSGNSHELNPDTKYVIKNKSILPNIQGNQIWLQVQPEVSSSGICTDGCWSFYGAQSIGPNKKYGNFSTVLP